MPLPSRTLRILGALLLSVAFVVAGYYFSSPLRTSIVGATSTEELLKQYAAKDSDTDGLPDWKESLYGTDPSNAHSVDSSMTDAEAVAAGKVAPKLSSATSSEPTVLTKDDFSVPAPQTGSFTDQFSQSFMSSFLSASGGGTLSDTDQSALLAGLMQEFTTKTAAQLQSSYTSSSVHVSAAATDAGYIASIEQTLLDNTVAADSADPMPLLSAYLENGDASAARKLLVLAGAYRGITTDLAAINVPARFAASHLELMRAFDALTKATTIVAQNYEKDPVSVLGAISIYAPAFTAITHAMQDLAQVVTPGDTSGALILQMAHSVTP